MAREVPDTDTGSAGGANPESVPTQARTESGLGVGATPESVLAAC